MHYATEHFNLAHIQLKHAKHILSVSYRTTQSPRLLLSTVEHLFHAMNGALNAALDAKHPNNRNRTIDSSFPSRCKAFQQKFEKHKLFDLKGIETLQRLQGILKEYEKSPMVFERDESLVICSN